jgi:hypothetical protein
MRPSGSPLDALADALDHEAELAEAQAAGALQRARAIHAVATGCFEVAASEALDQESRARFEREGQSALERASLALKEAEHHELAARTARTQASASRTVAETHRGRDRRQKDRAPAP